MKQLIADVQGVEHRLTIPSCRKISVGTISAITSGFPGILVSTVLEVGDLLVLTSKGQYHCK